MIDRVTMEFRLFRAPDMSATCATDVRDGEMCRFLGLRRFGTQPVCMFGSQTDLGTTDPRTGGGYTIPHDKCPIWEGLR